MRQATLQRLAREDVSAPEVAAAADAITAAAHAVACCDARQMMRARVALALALVQSLPWFDDAGTAEVYQRARTTLARGGTCHDKSELLVALLLRLGIATAKVVWVDQDDAPQNHVAVQLVVDGQWCYAGQCHSGWCYAETTVAGARVCEDPYDAERRLDGARTLRGDARVGKVRLPPANGQSVVSARPGKAPTPATSAPLVPGGTSEVQTAAMPLAQPARPVTTKPLSHSKPRPPFALRMARR